MVKNEKHYNNNYSFIFGVLCLGVVYLHSVWAGGFDIYTLGLENDIVRQGISLFLMTIVPIFFILWGYLACKYFYDNEKAGAFLRRKVIQFYPIYLFSFMINLLTRIDYMLALPKWKIILALFGIYYESGLRGGGHIFLVVISVVITISIFKKFNLRQNSIFFFTVLCLMITKILPHDEAGICYIMYFGYYTAFFLGVTLRHFSTFDDCIWNKSFPARFVISTIFLIGFITPILNLFKIYFIEIDYNPNSPEQLCFCVFVLFLFNQLINKYTFLMGNSFFPRIIHKIGNNAYAHFMLQSYMIHLIIFLNVFLSINKLLLQIIIIMSTSCLVVYLFIPLYRVVSSVVLNRLIQHNKNSLNHFLIDK